MATRLGERDEVIKRVSEKIGFPFKEEELSPKLRKEIGELAEMQNNIQILYSSRRYYEVNISKGLQYIIGLVIIGFIAVLLGIAGWGFALFGFILWGIGYLIYRVYYIPNKKSFSETEASISATYAKLEERVSAMAQSVYNELSEIHQARVRPMVTHITVNFAEIIRAARGKGIILDNIECPYCKAPLSIPKTGESVQCSHCGKTVYATNVFEALRNLLKTD